MDDIKQVVIDIFWTMPVGEPGARESIQKHSRIIRSIPDEIPFSDVRDCVEGYIDDFIAGKNCGGKVCDYRFHPLH